MVVIDQQSPNIADGVHVNRPAEEIGAGDQVYFFCMNIHYYCIIFHKNLENCMIRTKKLNFNLIPHKLLHEICRHN